MDASNFGVGPDGRAVLFDAATIQALPVTLADFTLLRTTSFATAVSQHVFDPYKRAARLASPSLLALAEVRRFLSMTFDDTLGMFWRGLLLFCAWVCRADGTPLFLLAGVDEDGNRRARARVRIS
jgi:hypothetical protein